MRWLGHDRRGREGFVVLDMEEENMTPIRNSQTQLLTLLTGALL